MMGNKPHKHVPITEYMAAPKQYAKRFCDKHPTEELTKACTLCHKIFCICDGAEILEICLRSQEGTFSEYRKLAFMVAVLKVRSDSDSMVPRKMQSKKRRRYYQTAQLAWASKILVLIPTTRQAIFRFSIPSTLCDCSRLWEKPT